MKQKGFAPILILLVLAGVGLLAYFGVFYKPPSQTMPQAISSASPSSMPSPSSNKWSKYVSKEVSNYFSPFELKYPEGWTMEENIKEETPTSLEVVLTKNNDNKIEIRQGEGGGGACVFYDDKDYLTFEGMGRFFSSYIQLNIPAQWRVSKPKDLDTNEYVVCEFDKNNRYIDTTRMGWITIKTDEKSLSDEILEILRKIIFKPSPSTKTLFD